MFRDRRDAGRSLAEELRRFAGPSTVVVGLPRGGVVVAREVATALGAPLDVVVVRKLGAPGQPELGIGAISEGGVEVLNDDLISLLGVSEALLAAERAQQQVELERRDVSYRRGRPALDVGGKTVVLVDDGLATGVTAKAAARSLDARGAARIVLAVPVGAQSAVWDLRDEVDEVVCLRTPAMFRAVGQWYDDFSQTTDDEVLDCLNG
jgi:putative phosphoribosyl transferase